MQTHRPAHKYTRAHVHTHTHTDTDTHSHIHTRFTAKPVSDVLYYINEPSSCVNPTLYPSLDWPTQTLIARHFEIQQAFTESNVSHNSSNGIFCEFTIMDPITYMGLQRFFITFSLRYAVFGRCVGSSSVGC